VKIVDNREALWTAVENKNGFPPGLWMIYIDSIMNYSAFQLKKPSNSITAIYINTLRRDWRI
jgi:hypothetical protein